MMMVRGVARLPEPPQRVVLTLGNFDGLHRGHQTLLQGVVARARELDGTAVLMTFDPPPARVLGKGDVPRIVTLEDKIDLIAAEDVDLVVVEPFTRELAGWEPEHFAREILLQRLDPVEIRVGYDFCFGRNRSGDVAFLRSFFQPLGREVIRVEAIREGGDIISSTRIREVIVAGDVGLAEEMLGRPHFVRGRVVPGDKRGRTIGFPTANVAPQTELVPAVGVYATWISAAGRLHLSVTNVGYRPTVGGSDLRIETHLFDFEGDLYGEEVTVWFSARLRGEQKFAGLDALKAQINVDALQARRVLHQGPPPAMALSSLGEAWDDED